MRTTLSLGPKAWQGLALSLVHDDETDPPLTDPACWVAGELLRLGGHVPVAVLLSALELHGYNDPHALVVEALSDFPMSFRWSAI